MQLALQPTHHVILGEFEVDINIPQSVLDKLDDKSDLGIRERNRNFVCIRFSNQCYADYGRKWGSYPIYVRFDELGIFTLQPRADDEGEFDDDGDCCPADCEDCRNDQHVLCGYGCKYQEAFLR